MQVFAKFVIVCEKYTILNHLIALEHTATKPVVFFSVNNPSYIRSYGFYKPSPSRQWALGTSVRAEYVMPFFAINAGIGYNFLAGTDDQRGLYQTLTLKVAVSRLVYLNIGYSLQRFKDPNHLMLGIGFRFHDKSPRLR